LAYQSTSALHRLGTAVCVLALVWVVTYWMMDTGGAGEIRSPSITIDATEFYVVQPGDRLDDIALQVYGDASRWEELFEANREVLGEPDAFRAGLRLIVPRGRESN
jgi:nucleoid-associated protein YgaU